MLSFQLRIIEEYRGQIGRVMGRETGDTGGMKYTEVKEWVVGTLYE